MVNVAYVTPNFTANAVRFIEAFVSFYNIRLFIISQEPISLLPAWQQSRISSSIQIADVSDANALIEALQKLAERNGKIQKVISASEPLQVPLAIARKALRIEGMEVDTAHQFRDKSQMKVLFEKAGIPCARHKVVSDFDNAVLFTKSTNFPYVLKPVAGAGAQVTFKISDIAELKEAFLQIGSNKEMIMEEFIEGNEFSIDTFSLNGKILRQTINQYYPTPLEVMKNPWMQWRVMLRQETASKEFDDIRVYCRKALDVLGMDTGMSHMEWFRKNDGSIAISEVAARPPGAQFTTLISRACDFNAVKSWVQLMVFDEARIPEVEYTSGAAYLRSQGSGRVSHVSGIEEMRSKYNDIITDIRLPFKGQEKSASYEGEGFIILRHKSSQVVEEALIDIVSTVKVHNE